jgi:hypothetical protein
LSDREFYVARLGFWSAILTAMLAVLFFAVGFATPLRSVAYPYEIGLASFVPFDYLWMYPGFLLAPIFLVLISSIHASAPADKKVFSQLGLAFATIYAAMVSTDYFIQLTVVTPSILKGETAGLSLFTQYNPHGIFVALESLGYLMMSLTFLFTAAVFTGGRLEHALRWIFATGFALAVGFLLGLSALGYDIVTFEVAIITINCTTLIVSGILLSILFRRIRRHVSKFGVPQSV